MILGIRDLNRASKKTVSGITRKSFVREAKRVGVVIELIIPVSVSESVAHQGYRSYFDIVASGIADVDDASPFGKVTAGSDDIAGAYTRPYAFYLGKNLPTLVVLALFRCKNNEFAPVAAGA